MDIISGSVYDSDFSVQNAQYWEHMYNAYQLVPSWHIDRFFFVIIVCAMIYGLDQCNMIMFNTSYFSISFLMFHELLGVIFVMHWLVGLLLY